MSNNLPTITLTSLEQVTEEYLITGILKLKLGAGEDEIKIILMDPSCAPRLSCVLNNSIFLQRLLSDNRIHLKIVGGR